jgi:hypothetical protein
MKQKDVMEWMVYGLEQWVNDRTWTDMGYVVCQEMCRKLVSSTIRQSSTLLDYMQEELDPQGAQDSRMVDLFDWTEESVGGDFASRKWTTSDFQKRVDKY